MRKKFLVNIVVCPLIMLLSAFFWAESHSLELVGDDCVKCHLDEVRDVVERGGLHKTEVGCTDCHEEHPPKGEETIPTCDSCHGPEDHAHYALENCASCHQPHYPLEMDLEKMDEVKAACLTCHSDQGQEMEVHPSEHAGLDCKECHMAHGEATQCMECHEAHVQEMVYKDCLSCHKPHGPTAIRFDGDVPSALCSSCHEGPVQEIEERGAAHQEVGCIDCHKQHPPSEEGVIPACAVCHGQEESPHYALENCASCHQPHYPLEMDLEKMDEVKAACLTCHSDQGQEMEVHPSEHAGLDCKECHMAHGEATQCMECHEAHTEEVIHKDCQHCHKPHKPLAVTYTGDITSSLCVSCHNRAGKDLAQTTTKHHGLQCVYCHKNEHKAVPQCITCHGQPHDFAIHGKYPDFDISLDCVGCHQNAHAPSQAMNAHMMAQECRTCHPEQKTETEKHPSAHAATSCVECHYDSHGFITSCAECHEEPHATGVDDAGCIACHPPHSPLEVRYSEDVANHICAGCHSDVNDKLSGSNEGHAFLQCVLCHADKHGYVPTCQDCHEATMHSEEMLKEFKGCLDCHGNAHVLKLQEP